MIDKLGRISGYIIIVFLFNSAAGYGQISPGDLSLSHADLEGISNCTKCHELGEKVTNAKCLECHTDIQSFITLNKGYHANSEVVNQDCFECHSDHHGRKFDMVRFDEDNFNHDQTSYTLEGKHEIIDCRKCHVADNIPNIEIRKRKNTFLGLEQECLSCHDDYHQKTLSTDCASCHDMEAFSPAPNFDHNETDYKLFGEHKSVDCKECHDVSNRNGQEFQKFNNVPFNDCKSCHDDPHNKQIVGKCSQCHTESSFSAFVGKGRFNHSSTGFALKGRHLGENCFSCHAKTSNPQLVFQDKIRTNENNCVSCHTDEHSGKYGRNCVKCHNESSFLSLNSMDFFDHSIADFPIEGKHLEVDCKQCHVGRFSTPIDYSACSSCHSDYHEGEFNNNGINPDCLECHSLENGFDYTLYSLEQHQTTTFPLEGAHQATPCFACHVSEEDNRWTFKNLGVLCIECHQDNHQTAISETEYRGIAYTCTFCHNNDTWSAVNFDHNITDWPLEGKHVEVDCRECHLEITEDNAESRRPLDTVDENCVSCHENKHDDLFAINGVTDCERCHVTDSWFPDGFDHNSTAFALEGRHEEIECSACHETINDKGETVIVYKLEKFECIDCH